LSSGEKAVETTQRNSPKCLPICSAQCEVEDLHKHWEYAAIALANSIEVP
jgi:hypothetical protein